MAPSTAASLNSRVIGVEAHASSGVAVARPDTTSSTADPRLDSAIQSHCSSLGVHVSEDVYTVTVVFGPTKRSSNRSLPAAVQSCRMCDTLMGNMVSCDG